MKDFISLLIFLLPLIGFSQDDYYQRDFSQITMTKKINKNKVATVKKGEKVGYSFKGETKRHNGIVDSLSSNSMFVNNTEVHLDSLRYITGKLRAAKSESKTLLIVGGILAGLGTAIVVPSVIFGGDIITFYGVLGMLSGVPILVAGLNQRGTGTLRYTKDWEITVN